MMHKCRTIRTITFVSDDWCCVGKGGMGDVSCLNGWLVHTVQPRPRMMCDYISGVAYGCTCAFIYGPFFVW